MMFLWYGLLFISISWLYIAEIFSPANWILYFIFLFGGVFFAWIGIWHLVKNDDYVKNKRLPFSIGNTFILVILIVLLQFLYLHIYFWITPHIGKIEKLAHIISSFGNLLGLDTIAQNGIVYVQTYVKIVPFSVTLEKLGFLPLSNFYLCNVVLFIFLKSNNYLKYLLRLTLIVIIYMLIRFVILMFIYIDFEVLSIYWNQIFIFISIIPLPILLIYLCPFKKFDVLNFRFNFDKHWLAFSSLVFFSIFFLIIALNYKDQGVVKKGRILIDDAHSNWEWTTIKFDKFTYGEKSTYNYYTFKNWLNHYYNVDSNVSQDITSRLLKDYDILIIKTPTRPFLVYEKEAILNFVKNGGGLFLIGDHTNLFGMTTNINPIADDFKIRFIADDTFDLTSGQPSLFKPYKIISHPVVQHVKKFEFETSCTLTAPLLSEHVIIGYGLGKEMVDYSHVNFFGNMKPDIDEEYGLFIQAVARKYWKGRVLAFSDSTVFSNFSMFYKGIPELALGSIEYLNRENNSDYLKYLLYIISFTCFLGTFFVLRKIDLKLILISVIVFSSLSFLLSCTLLRYFNIKNYPLPKPHTKYTVVSFSEEYSNFRIPAMLEYQSPDPQNCFDAFYVNTQRLNLYPSLEDSLLSSFEKADVIVIINPSKNIKKKDLSVFYDYVFNGGRVLLLESYNNTHSIINKFLKVIDMEISKDASNSSNNQIKKTGTHSTDLTIKGGKIVKIPLDFSNENNVLISEKKVGKGKVLVVLGSEWLSRQYMGQVFLNPDAKQLEFYNLEYFLFEGILLKD